MPGVSVAVSDSCTSGREGGEAGPAGTEAKRTP